MKLLHFSLLLSLLAATSSALPSKEKITEAVIEESDATLCDDIHPEEITKNIEDDTAVKVKNLLKGVKVAEIEEEYVPVEQPEPQVSYAGSQLLRVVLDTKDKKKLIAKLRDTHDISMWGGNTSAIDILVSEHAKENVLKSLASSTINYEVVIDNVQTAIDEENPIEEVDELDNRQGHQMTWSSYHRLNNIHGYLDYLGNTYPNLVSTQVIGTSIKGRPLKLVKISNGKQGNRAIWVDGGMHAREWISPASVTYIINDLVLNYDSQPLELRDLDWYILPVANPDGYEYSHETDRLWRKNRARHSQCAGTDLNRNFGYKWGGRGSGHNQCQEIYAGTGPFSEPESNAIRNFITYTKANWQGYVSFHSYGQYILYPWGYDRVITNDHQEMTRVAQAAANAIRSVGGPSYTIGPAGSTLYPASGGSDDWAKGSMKMKYAYTIELRDTGRHGFLLPAPFIKPTATEAFAALRVIAKAVSKS